MCPRMLPPSPSMISVSSISSQNPDFWYWSWKAGRAETPTGKNSPRFEMSSWKSYKRSRSASRTSLRRISSPWSTWVPFHAAGHRPSRPRAVSIVPAPSEAVHRMSGSAGEREVREARLKPRPRRRRRHRRGATHPAGSCVVHDVDRSIGVAPDVDTRVGLSDRPTAVGLDPVMEADHRAVVPDTRLLLTSGRTSFGPRDGVVHLHVAGGVGREGKGVGRRQQMHGLSMSC